MDLTMDVGVQDVLDHGFYPELPWSLYASGSLWVGNDSLALSRPIFEHVPFSRLASVLVDGLERGLQILNSMTASEILTQGQIGGRSTEPGAQPNHKPTKAPSDLGITEGPPSKS